jgi:hypothetical protein
VSFLPHSERLRRAVADASRAASAANQASWRARKKLDEVLEVAQAMQRGGLTEPIRLFVLAEATRQQAQAMHHEGRAWNVMNDISSLAELIGAKEK